MRNMCTFQLNGNMHVYFSACGNLNDSSHQIKHRNHESSQKREFISEQQRKTYPNDDRVNLDWISHSSFIPLTSIVVEDNHTAKVDKPNKYLLE